MKVVVVLLLLWTASADAQERLSKGYEVSAMGYDSLGLQVRVDEGKYHRRGFEAMVSEECAGILQRNGITCVVSRDGEPVRHYPCIVIDIAITALPGSSTSATEVYYGTLSFRREVTVEIARRPWKTTASTWSMTLGGPSRNRMEMIADIEERLTDFLVDYLKLNSAVWIWRK